MVRLPIGGKSIANSSHRNVTGGKSIANFSHRNVTGGNFRLPSAQKA